MPADSSITAEESSILNNTDFLLLKQKVIRKLWSRLEILESSIKNLAVKDKNLFPEEIDFTGKVSRGENYKHLPYLVLDCPRLLRPGNIFTIRTMIWWGNEVSCTLHIQGKALNNYRNLLSKQVPFLPDNSFYLCVNSTPWQYHFKSDNYHSINHLPKNEVDRLIKTSDFIKISRKIDISKINQMEDFTLDTYQYFRKLLSPTL